MHQVGVGRWEMLPSKGDALAQQESSTHHVAVRWAFNHTAPWLDSTMEP